MPLGAADLAAATDTEIYAVPAGKKASVNVAFCARTQSAVVRLAVTDGALPAAKDWIEYDAALAAADILERTQIWMTAGEKLYARASATGVSVVVYGPEENL
ncbi:MAG: hypothetical protein ACE5FM_02075 [Methyloligellaceae bacterium]